MERTKLVEFFIFSNSGRGRGVVGDSGMAGVQGVAGDIEGSGEESAADVGAERGDRGKTPEQPRRGM